MRSSELGSSRLNDLIKWLWRLGRFGRGDATAVHAAALRKGNASIIQNILSSSHLIWSVRLKVTQLKVRPWLLTRPWRLRIYMGRLQRTGGQPPQWEDCQPNTVVWGESNARVDYHHNVSTASRTQLYGETLTHGWTTTTMWGLPVEHSCMGRLQRTGGLPLLWAEDCRARNHTVWH